MRVWVCDINPKLFISPAGRNALYYRQEPLCLVSCAVFPKSFERISGDETLRQCHSPGEFVVVPGGESRCWSSSSCLYSLRKQSNDRVFPKQFKVRSFQCFTPRA